jgi:hypothetical protein
VRGIRWGKRSYHGCEKEVREARCDTHKSFSSLRARAQTSDLRLSQLYVRFAVNIGICAGSVSGQIAKARMKGSKYLGGQ